jgi:hypothetical protein
LFVANLAVQSGTLIAKRGTVQGESGWYAGPDGSIYYLILENGNWTLTAGPISADKYNDTLRQTRLKDSHAMGAMLTPCSLPAAPGGPIPEDAMVFIENNTKKLFYARPVGSATS